MVMYLSIDCYHLMFETYKGQYGGQLALGILMKYLQKRFIQEVWMVKNIA